MDGERFNPTGCPSSTSAHPFPSPSSAAAAALALAAANTTSRTHTPLSDIPDSVSVASVASREETSTPATRIADDSASVASDTPVSAGEIKILVNSPVGGALDFKWKTDGQPNDDVAAEIRATIEVVLQDYHDLSSVLVRQGRSPADVNWSSLEEVREYVTVFNRLISAVGNLWRGATKPSAEKWSTQFLACTGETHLQKLLMHICKTSFNRSIKDVRTLNKHYEPFSSEVYGETSYEQMSKILETLKLKDGKDVFVDLGSGVGHLVAFVAGGCKVKKCVGIEKAELPAAYATTLSKEFKKVMSFYGKKHRPFELHHGDFLDEKYRNLITKEATVIFINNYAFTSNLNTDIKNELIAHARDGARIISTKEFVQPGRSVNDRHMNDVASILDVEVLPTVESCVSWTVNKVDFYLHTVNHAKLERYYLQKKERETQSGSSSETNGASNQRRTSNSSNHSSRDSSEGRSPLPMRETGKGKEEEERLMGTPRGSKLREEAVGKRGRKKNMSWDQPDEEYVPEGKKSKISSSRVVTPRLKPHKAVSKCRPTSSKVTGDANRTLGMMHRMTETLASHTPSIQEVTAAAAARLHPLNPLPHKATVQEAEGPEAPAVIKVESCPVPPLPPAAEAAACAAQKQPPAESCLPPCPQGFVLQAIPVDAVVLNPVNPIDRYIVNTRNAFLQFLEYLTTDEAKQRIIADIQQQNTRHNELKERMRQLTATVEGLLNAGVHHLNARLIELDMTDVTTPAEMINRSKHFVARHKEITVQVASYESQCVALERQITQSVPYGAALLDKIETADFSKEDAYGVMISQACAEASSLATGGEKTLANIENDPRSVAATPSALPVGESLLSPGSQPARRSRQRPRVNTGGRRGAAGAGGAGLRGAAGAGTEKGGEENNEEMERQIKEIVQKALQVDSQAKEKERRARTTTDKKKGGVAGGSSLHSSNLGEAAGLHFPPSSSLPYPEHLQSHQQHHIPPHI